MIEIWVIAWEQVEDHVERRIKARFEQQARTQTEPFAWLQWDEKEDDIEVQVRGVVGDLVEDRVKEVLT